MQITKRKRDVVFDYIKLYSMLMVITHHFMVCYLKYESVPLKIVNGKYGVQLFSVILGIFAYRSGQKKKEDTIHYALRRYSFFFICEMVINSIYYFFNIDGSQLRMSYGYVIGRSLVLGDEIFPTIWFAKEFLAGSIISFILGRYRPCKRDILALILCLGVIDEVFVAGCVMGSLVQNILEEDDNAPVNKFIPAVAVAISVMIRIILNKSSLTYFIFGITSSLTILLIKKSGFFSQDPGRINVSYLGGITMPMLLIHPCLIELVNHLDLASSDLLNVTLRYLILMVLVLIASLVIDFIIKHLSRLANRIIDFLFERIEKIAMK